MKMIDSHLSVKILGKINQNTWDRKYQAKKMVGRNSKYHKINYIKARFNTETVKILYLNHFLIESEYN